MELKDIHTGDRVVAESRGHTIRGNITLISSNGIVSIKTSAGGRSVHYTEITRMVKRAK